MKKSFLINIVIALALVAGLSACSRDFDIDIKTNNPLLVVEGYINNEIPEYSYVVLSRSQDYYSPDFQSVPVRGAVVTITEGTMGAGNNYEWNTSSKTALMEVAVPQLTGTLLPGVYFDQRVVTDSANALKGVPGKHYLLEIEAGGKNYSAITFLPPVIAPDSLSSGYYFVDEDEDSIENKARLTVHYKDPDTIGNTQLYYWQRYDNRENVGWGGLNTSRFTLGTDDLTNGQYMNLTLPASFLIGDTVNFYMASVERKVYNFWESFRKAESNGGPFATPVVLSSTINGENTVGCFSGFSLAVKTVAIK